MRSIRRFAPTTSRRCFSSLSRVSDSFPGSGHARNPHLDSGTSDGEILEYAREHGFTMLSEDWDFRPLSVVRGAPSKAVWFRVADCGVGELREMLRTPVIVAGATLLGS